MSHDADKPTATAAPGRRDFLKAMSGAGAAAVAVAVAVSEPVAAQAPERESRDERTKARYRADSPDVQAFYRTNRY